MDGAPSRCPVAANGIHQDGTRCGNCNHQHCRLCLDCVRCERANGMSCRHAPFNGEQGRVAHAR